MHIYNHFSTSIYITQMKALYDIFSLHRGRHRASLPLCGRAPRDNAAALAEFELSQHSADG